MHCFALVVVDVLVRHSPPCLRRCLDHVRCFFPFVELYSPPAPRPPPPNPFFVVWLVFCFCFFRLALSSVCLLPARTSQVCTAMAMNTCVSAQQPLRALDLFRDMRDVGRVSRAHLEYPLVRFFYGTFVCLVFARGCSPGSVAFRYPTRKAQGLALCSSPSAPNPSSSRRCLTQRCLARDTTKPRKLFESTGVPPPLFRDGPAGGLRGAGALGRRSGGAEGAQRFRGEGEGRGPRDTQARSGKYIFRVCSCCLSTVL